MSVFCKELKRNFDSKAEMFAALKEDKEHIIGLKKAALKDTDPVMLQIRDVASKEDIDMQVVDIGSTIYAVINSCGWLDSHVIGQVGFLQHRLQFRFFCFLIIHETKIKIMVWKFIIILLHN